MNKFLLIFTYFSFFFSLINAQGVSTDSPDPAIIYSVSNTEQHDNTHAYISIAGGQNIFIKGTGFQLTPEMNDVYFVGENEQFSCTVTGATKVFITCLSEEVPDGYERSSLNVVVVVNGQSKKTSTCGNSECKVSYRYSVTPKLFSIFPRSATPGTKVYWNGIYGVKSTEFIVLEQLKIGEFYCDRFDLGDRDLNPQSKELVDCVIAWDAIGGIYTDPNDPIAQGVRAIGKYAGPTKPMSSLMMRTADRTNQYAFRIIPAIDQLNTNIGSPMGQIIQIRGMGFTKMASQLKVKVAGIECIPTTTTLSLIVCEVKAGSSALGGIGTGYIGGSGLIRSNFSLSTYTTPSQLKEQVHLPVAQHYAGMPKFIFEDVAFELEQMTVEYDYYGEVMRGYFRAPATGIHKFFISGDDLAEIWFSLTPNSTDTSNLQKIAYITNYTGFRSYNEQDTQISSGMQLVKDSYYYMEVYHMQWTGTGHVSVAVESPSDVYYPDSSLPTIQTVKIDFNPDYEKIMMKVYLDSKPASVSGYWKFNFCGDSSKEIAWGASGDTVASRLNNDIQYFKASCERQYLDKSGNIIEDANLATGYQYDCTFYKWRDYWDALVIKSSNYKYPNIITTYLQPLNSEGGLIAVHSQKAHVADPEMHPLKGSFTLSYNGKSSTSIAYDDSANTVYNKLTAELGLSSKIQVEESGDEFSGLSWKVTMYGEQSPGIISIGSDELTGGDETHSPKVVITKDQTGSNNIFYNPISNDLLFQNKTDPQVQVFVNDVLGTCVKHNCQYKIEADSTPEIKTALLEPAASDSKMTITLDPKTFTVTESLVHITINGVTCKISSFTAGAEISMTCVPPRNDDNSKYLIPAGVIKPRVHIEGIGFAIDNAISTLTIPLVIDSVDPSDIPAFGGAPIAIVGSGFPLTLADAQAGLVITLSGSQCEVLASESTKITFTSPKITSETDVALAFNSLTATQAVTFNYTPGPGITSITPTTASPVQKTDLVITGSNFKQSTEDDTWYKCIMIGRDAAHTSYTLDVLPGSVTDTSMTCILSGGVQATYDIFVRKIKKDGTSTFLGYLSNSSSNPLAVQYQLDITQISPSSGSKAGGTLLTLSGVNFALQNNQNLVVIGVDSYSCAIESSTADTVTCRTVALPDDDNGGSMLVSYYQRVQEKGTCTAANCEFTFTAAATPVITTGVGSALTFGAGDVLTFSGSLLTPSSGKKTYLIFSDQKIEASSNTANSVSFTMPGIVAGTYSANILVDNLGYAQFAGSLSLTSKFEILQASPVSISEGGSLLTITGNGFSATTKVKIDTIGDCQIVEYTTTTIKCRTLPIAGSNLKVQIFDKNTPTTLLTCSTCKISADAAKTATITANNATTATSANSIAVKFDGTNIDLVAQSDITCELVSSESPYTAYTGTVTSSSGTSLEASFSNLPAGQYKAFINLKDKGYAKFNPIDLQILAIDTGALTVSAITSSFVGGQALTISGDGFPSDASSGISIKVCGFDCPITSSAYDEIKCKVPEVVTEKSNEEFLQVKASNLKAVNVTGDDMSLAPLASDGLLSTSYSSEAEDCFIILDHGANLQAQVQQIIYSPKSTIGLSVFDQSKFMGCNEDCDNDANWATIYQIEQIYMTYGLNIWKPEDGATISSYRYVKFTSPNKVVSEENLVSGCQLAEFYVYGVLVTPSATDDLTCDVVMNINGKEITESGKVTYQVGATPTITELIPPFGSSLGGEEIEITGTGFGSASGVVTVLLEGQECSVTAVSATSITCTTIARNVNWSNDGFEHNTLKVVIDGQIAANHQNNWMYVDRWSLKTTWGGESPPMKGQSAYIPAGRNVLIDESLPELYSIIIEGSFICASFPDYIPDEITIDAWFIVCNRGMVQIGTEKKRYEKKLTITLHGSLSDTQLPLFGNKVLAVFEGLFDMHGKVRTPTWTSLSETAVQGSATIKVEYPGDWGEGDLIVIATNDFDYNHTEVRYITAVSGSVLTLNETLNYTHFSATETYGSQDLPMKCEVALLSRTIKIQGADGSWEDRYGGHTMVTGEQDHGSIGRISYTEFYHCGQQKILGRYPIHFHLGGKRDLSYADGNAVHESLARVTTIHGIHFLRVTNTVGYYISGHAIFIEDGVETHNLVKDNLVINTRQVWTLIQTDVQASCIWVTHPLNDVIGNRCAGGDWFGIWYELFVTPTGPSVDPTVCPEGLPMGKFENNTAHSYMKYGFRAKQHWPRKYACSYFINPTLMDQYGHNPSYEVVYGNFMAWKNHDNGFQFEHPGHVLIKNITVADNGLAGMIIWSTNHSHSKTCRIMDSTIIGLSNGNAEWPKIIYKGIETRGLVTPSTDGLYVENVKFYNFNEEMTATASCAVCWHLLKNITGGVVTHFKSITFDSSVKRKLWWEVPRREIYHDLDGSFGGTGKESYITPYLNHLHDSTLCSKTENESGKEYDIYNGSLICDGTNNELRQIVFKGLHPWDDFQAVYMNILRIDDDSKAIEDYDFDADWTHLERAWNYKNTNDTRYTFGCAFMTGKKYRVHWGHMFPMDWKTLMIMPSVQEWQAADKNLILQFNHTQPRELYDISEWFVNGSFSKVLNEETKEMETMFITPKASIAEFTKRGEYFHDSTAKLLSVNIAGDTDSTIHMTPISCRFQCPDLLEGCEDETFIRKWSNVTTWAQQDWFVESNPRIPQAGDNITIPCGYSVLIDVEETPKLEHIEVNGHLIFNKDQEMTKIYMKTLWVRQGSIKAGESEQDPFPGKIEFNFYGHSSDDHILIAEDLEAGNKLFAITNTVELYGSKIPSSVNTRLKKSVNAGDYEIQIVRGGANGWQVGDELGISPTSFNGSEYEKVKIAAIAEDKITLEKALLYDHYGAENYIITNAGNLDMRAIVSHLTRNIVIQSIDHDDEDIQIGRWGCHVLIGGYTEKDTDQPEIEDYWIFRIANATLVGVEVRYCGQPSSTRAAVDFYHNYDSADNVKKEENKLSYVPKSIFHHGSVHSSVGKCMYMEMARNISVYNNAIFHCRKYGIWVYLKTDMIFIENNVIIGIYDRDDIDQSDTSEMTAGVMLRDPQPNKILSLKNNAVVGGLRYGYLLYGQLCKGERFYRNNSAGSVYTGVVAMNNISTCMWLTEFQLYKNYQGIDAHFEYETLLFEDIVFAENKMGVHTSIGIKEFPYNIFKYKNIYMAPIARPDCEECYKTTNDCSNFIGIVSPGTEWVPNHIPFYRWYSVQKYCKDHNFDCRLFIDDSEFKNWKVSYSDETNYPWLSKCKKNFAFTGYKPSLDQLADTYLYNSTCTNCQVSGLAKFLDEDLSCMGWLGGCGMMLCIGHRNWMVSDIDGKFIGGGNPVQLVPNNPDLFRGKEQLDCSRNDDINGYYCKGNPFTVLHFEAFGKDELKRLLSPVNISASHGYNVINAQREWHWDGPLPKDLRRNRFYAIVKKGGFYNVTYGTVPHPFMRYQLIGRKNPNNENDYMVLQVFYIETSGAPRVYVNGDYRKPYRVDEDVDLILKSQNDCGANIYYYKNNTISFLINTYKECMITVNQSSVIYVTTYLTTTEQGFYTDNVASTFLDRMMTFLGISFNNIRILNVRNGTARRRQLGQQDFVLEWEIFTKQDETQVSTQDVQSELKAYVNKIANANASELSNSKLTYLESNYTILLKKTTEELKQEEISKAQGQDENSETELDIIPVQDSSGNQIIPIAEVQSSDNSNNAAVLVIIFVLSTIFIIIIILLLIYFKKKNAMYKTYLARAKMTGVVPEFQNQQEIIQDDPRASSSKSSRGETGSLVSSKKESLQLQQEEENME